MGFNLVRCNNFRNLKGVDIAPSSAINLIIGENASGKSNFLESIFYLGRAKSFRTNKLHELINFDEEETNLFARYRGKGDIETSIGIERKRNLKKEKIKVDGNYVKSKSELAKHVPVQMLHPPVFRMFDESPSHRRKFIDFGLFHVEQLFHSVWKSYTIALSNRNHLLKKGNKDDLRYWDREILDLGNQLNQFRSSYLNELHHHLMIEAAKLFEAKDIKFSINCGWKKGLDFSQALKNSFERDVSIGYTSVGPHLFDFAINFGRINGKIVLSNGQKKLLVFALHTAQAIIISTAKSNPGILLFDEVSSELDAANRDRVFAYISELNVQSFLTGTDELAFSSLPVKPALFHVEHGKIFS